MKRQFAEHYSGLQDWHWWFKGRQEILESVLRRNLPAPREGRRIIASVGSGPPSGLSWLVPFVGAEGLIVGLDADPSGSLRASLKAEAPRFPSQSPSQSPSNVRLLISELERPAIRSGSCDGVLALDVLEHLDDDSAGLQAAAHLVTPGGLLLVTVPALPSLWGQQDVVSQHRRRYTRASLQNLFERGGLGRPRITYFNSILFLPIAAVRYARRFLTTSKPDVSDFDDARPGVINNQLRRVFSTERHLVDRVNLPIGVSLMAIYRAA
jgi:SAM-dependent methyltransferase